MADVSNVQIVKEQGYNNEGAYLNLKITAPWEELKVFTLPKSCYQCPVGFSCSGHCGRNVPFTKEDSQRRPDSCVLEQITVGDIYKLISDHLT